MVQVIQPGRTGIKLREATLEPKRLAADIKIGSPRADPTLGSSVKLPAPVVKPPKRGRAFFKAPK